MIGIILVTHGDLGKAFISAITHILGETPIMLEEVSTDNDLHHNSLRQKIIDTCNRLNTGSGVLVLADIIGGSPANYCCEFVDDKNIAAIAGVNLPILIRAINHREEMSLLNLVEFLVNGQDNIIHKLNNRSRYADCH